MLRAYEARIRDRAYDESLYAYRSVGRRGTAATSVLRLSNNIILVRAVEILC